MQYANLVEFQQDFIQGKISQFPSTITVSQVEYELREHRDISWKDIVSGKSTKALTTYRAVPSKENLEILSQSTATPTPNRILLLGWGLTHGLRLIPIGTLFTTLAQSTTTSVSESVEISFEEPTVIHGINDNNPINGKIDTGADMCSLHATDIKSDGGATTFTHEGRTYTVPTAGNQVVKQADSGEESRPTVRMTFTIQGQTIKDVECNLNDRTGMSPLLIGRNMLEQGDFTIGTQRTEQQLESMYVDDVCITESQWDAMECRLSELYSDYVDHTNTKIFDQIADPSSPLNLFIESLN